jgi:hypothetical protein
MRVLGRRNCLFIWHREAGDRAAIFCSLMACCPLHGINPFEYPKDVSTRLRLANITEIESFSPDEWAKRQVGTKARIATQLPRLGNAIHSSPGEK